MRTMIPLQFSIALLALLAGSCSSPLVDDYDGDGFTLADDCNDWNPDVHPGATEVCDGLDNDCDAAVDEGAATDAVTWFADFDGDGYGDAETSTDACFRPAGHVSDGTDCDDGDPAIHPGAAEADCTDPVDYNCDGSTQYDDFDEDGSPACEDCDDTDADIRAGAFEFCNDVDDDCDGFIDEDAVDAQPWYADLDRDGYGGAFWIEACDPPPGYPLGEGGDCDDLDPLRFPGADERCNELDDDCDGEIDEDPADPDTWYLDDDGDGYGDVEYTSIGCVPASGYVESSEDCDDGDSEVFPGGDEYCDGADNDCDGDIDEADALDPLTWYADLDGDSYGDSRYSTQACDQPSGYVASSDDCNDLQYGVNPGATDICGDGVDQDCSGADETCS